MEADADLPTVAQKDGVNENGLSARLLLFCATRNLRDEAKHRVENRLLSLDFVIEPRGRTRSMLFGNGRAVDRGRIDQGICERHQPGPVRILENDRQSLFGYAAPAMLFYCSYQPLFQNTVARFSVKYDNGLLIFALKG